MGAAMFSSISGRFAAISIAVFLLAGYGAAATVWAADNDAADATRHKQAFIEAMAPQGTQRQVIAIVALNQGTEMTDLLVPHAVLKRADIAGIQMVAPRRGPVSLYPALQVQATQDFAGFDQLHPQGADYVIVPAMEPDNDPAVMAWLQGQAQLGARIIAVCSGARVAGQAGLLDGRRFAGHWYDRSTLLKRHPGAVHVPDRRYLADRGVATTTGITASVPTMLALVEALGGPDKAARLAEELGVEYWGPAHDSDAFGVNFSRGFEYALNKAAFWRDSERAIDVSDGMDDIALALAVDAWSRTGHARVVAASPSGPVTLRSGLILDARPAAQNVPRLSLAKNIKPVQQLDAALSEIAARYGDARRDWVMQEMEYSGAVR